MDTFSYISNAEPGYIEGLYNNYKADPFSIESEWKKFFEGFDFAVENFSSNGDNHALIENKPSSQENLQKLDLHSPVSETTITEEFKVYQLIQAFRLKGHLISNTNPIRPRKDRHANLEPEFFGLHQNQLQQQFFAGTFIGLGRATLEHIINHLKNIYCRSIGFEYMYIIEPDELKWLQERFESGYSNPVFQLDQKNEFFRS